MIEKGKKNGLVKLGNKYDDGTEDGAKWYSAKKFGCLCHQTDVWKCKSSNSPRCHNLHLVNIGVS